MTLQERTLATQRLTAAGAERIQEVKLENEPGVTRHDDYGLEAMVARPGSLVRRSLIFWSLQDLDAFLAPA